MDIAVEAKSGFAPIFYVIVIIVILILVLIGVLIKKKSFNFDQLIKIFVKSLVITLVINFLLFILIYFTSSQPMCGPCAFDSICSCPSKLDTILPGLIYTIPSIFLITLLVKLIIKKDRDNN